ncbi:MAG: hypothetical protein U0Q11_17635 [Vicinamibacterales bacterium]
MRDGAGHALGLHPRLSGLWNIFNEGRLAVVQRTRYPESSRSHFEAYDVFGSAFPQTVGGSGWLDRYLDTLPRPVDNLTAWNTAGGTPRALQSVQSSVVSIPDASSFAYASPNYGQAALDERATAEAMAANRNPRSPQLAFVNSIDLSALETLDRVAGVASAPADGRLPLQRLSLALQTVAGAIAQGITSRVWVQTGGCDTRTPARAAATATTANSWVRSATHSGRSTPISWQPGAAERHDRHGLLRVRPPDHRERQPRHRPRGCRADVRAWRHGPRRSARHGRDSHSGTSDARV